MEVSEIRGTLLGPVFQGNPTTLGSPLGVPYFRKRPHCSKREILPVWQAEEDAEVRQRQVQPSAAGMWQEVPDAGVHGVPPQLAKPPWTGRTGLGNGLDVCERAGAG